MKSTDVIQPVAIATPIAISGSKDSIPQLAANAQEAWYCSIEKGFPDITMQALNEGGRPPRGQGINGLLNITSDQKVFLQNGGIITFNQNVSNAIGGYPQGAILDYVTNNTYFKVESLIDDNTYNFVTTPGYIDGTHWKLLGNGGDGANTDLSNLTTTGNNKILPSQSGNSGKYLTTNGTTPSWAAFSKSTVGLGNVDNTSDLNKPISTATQSALDNKADIALSNLSATGNARLHALKGYTDEGELLTDSEGLFDVEYYAHSTFDSTKFTKVGSPTVTSDGIASGFSSSNYLMTSTIDFTKPWEIISTFKIDNASSEKMLWAIQGSGWFNYVYIGQSLSTFIFTFKVSDNTEKNLRIEYAATINTLYKLSIGWTGTTYYAKLYDINGTLLQEKTVNSALTLNVTSGYIQLGYGSSGGYSLNGSIDLKQFSITVDGVPVFSGNKTGIDTIKPNDYTVVGSPTISDDGIASGFSNSNYLTYALPAIGNNKFEIICKVNSGTFTQNNNCIFRLGTNQYRSVLLRRENHFRVWLVDTQGTDLAQLYTPNILDNTNYYIKFGWDKSKYYLYYSLDKINWTTTGSNQEISSSDLLSSYNQNGLYIGYTASNNNYMYGSIDLNAFKIYVNGDLVYQPCLKIPYTESKTGSKVVDSYYRDRVNDMYNQFGCAPYYTLDESNNNFTLPRGEVYGMMINKTTPYVTQTYINSASWYRVWSDGWCEQGTTKFLNDGDSYTFLKAFKDTNYTIISCPLGYSSDNDHNWLAFPLLKSTTSCTFTVFDSDTGESTRSGSVCIKVCGYVS